MSKQILLARPHPFIVSEMCPFLEQNGFNPVKLGSLSELIKLKATPLNGVIISLAVQSSVEETAGMVFAAIRKQFPQLPIACAGLLDVAMANKTIRQMLPQPPGEFHVIGVETGNERRMELGQANTFVYVRNTDLSTPARAKIAAQLLQAHFK